MPRFSLKQLFLGTAIIALGITTLISLTRYADPFDNVAFAPTAWARGDEWDRAPMSRDLVRNHLPRGLTRKQLEALLGEPYFVVTKDDPKWFAIRGSEAYVYYIGEWGFLMDEAYVCVDLDPSGNVIQANIRF